MKEQCGNCRFYKHKFAGAADEYECHRRAPEPVNAFAYHVADLIRGIGWIIHQKEIGKPDDDDDVSKEVTEVPTFAFWPDVERDDWCGEWQRKKGK